MRNLAEMNAGWPWSRSMHFPISRNRDQAGVAPSSSHQNLRSDGQDSGMRMRHGLSIPSPLSSVSRPVCTECGMKVRARCSGASPEANQPLPKRDADWSGSMQLGETRASCRIGHEAVARLAEWQDTTTSFWIGANRAPPSDQWRSSFGRRLASRFPTPHEGWPTPEPLTERGLGPVLYGHPGSSSQTERAEISLPLWIDRRFPRRSPQEGIARRRGATQISYPTLISRDNATVERPVEEVPACSIGTAWCPRWGQFLIAIRLSVIAHACPADQTKARIGSYHGR